ncbi:helix-turn-helix transcriptional regulator [Pseudoalteromonas xiamenensis]|uniref:helix-turn-helix domain-containing protein n=1 Tax=Pseudoalteromonas xiamenensis TaxID=882626 RepID=UPI0027E3DDC8|nr:helix-turn-helix transcriptional regulator [Pseudoalteromonas xiamenensis]WMN61366.1 helix-turn-helix transcriptional regulator [Pseudoalteromonas xiamenensis]
MQTPEEYEITLRVNALVKGLKKRRGYTKKDISQKLGIGLTTFNDYLNGVSSFKLGTLIQFAALCKLTLPDILDDTLEAKKLYSEDLADRANAGKNTLDFLALAFFLPAILSVKYMLITTCLSFVVLIFLSGKNINNRYLSGLLLAHFCVELLMLYPIKLVVFPHVNGFEGNIIAFGIQFILFVLLIYFVRFRIVISLYMTKAKCPKVLQLNCIDAPLIALLFGYALLNLGAFIENLIRNLEHLGVDENFAKQFWKLTYIYDNFEAFNLVLTFMTVVVLYIGIKIQERQDKQSAVFQSQESI